MASQPDSKAEVAAEKAYREAADQVSVAKIAEAVAAPKASPARKGNPAPKTKAKPARKAPQATKPRIAKPKDTIMATANKTTDFTATARNAAGDFQTRAKGAYDKAQAYTGQVAEFAKGNVEALVESSKILAAGAQDIARGEVEAARGAFETATADMKALAAVKSPTELFKLQGEIARRNFDAAVARASKNAEVSMKLANEAFAPISSRMSIAAEKVSKAA